jgi:hypothetical protein
MPRAGFEPVIPVFELSKTVPALDRDALIFNQEMNEAFLW